MTTTQTFTKLYKFLHNLDVLPINKKSKLKSALNMIIYDSDFAESEKIKYINEYLKNNNITKINNKKNIHLKKKENNKKDKINIKNNNINKSGEILCISYEDLTSHAIKCLSTGFKEYIKRWETHKQKTKRKNQDIKNNKQSIKKQCLLTNNYTHNRMSIAQFKYLIKFLLNDYIIYNDDINIVNKFKKTIEDFIKNNENIKTNWGLQKDTRIKIKKERSILGHLRYNILNSDKKEKIINELNEIGGSLVPINNNILLQWFKSTRQKFIRNITHFEQ